jgi:hypothetical protein
MNRSTCPVRPLGVDEDRPHSPVDQMDRDRAPQDPGPDDHDLTITVGTHMRSFARPPRAGAPAARSVWVAASARARGDLPSEDVAVRPYREPAAAAMLEVPATAGITGARRFPWDAAYEMS